MPPFSLVLDWPFNPVNLVADALALISDGESAVCVRFNSMAAGALGTGEPDVVARSPVGVASCAGALGLVWARGAWPPVDIRRRTYERAMAELPVAKGALACARNAHNLQLRTGKTALRLRAACCHGRNRLTTPVAARRAGLRRGALVTTRRMRHSPPCSL